MSAIPTTGKIRREAVDASIASQKLQLVYRPETHSMAEITAAIVAAAASGETVYLGPGQYVLNVNLPNGGSAGFGIVGAGRNKTFLISAIPNTPVFACQGLWYSRFVGLSFSHHSLGAGTMPAVDIDGVIGGRGVQGNTWQDCSFSGRGWFDGLLGHTAFYMCRVATNAGQGSENCFINCHFSGATFACYAQTGYNALNNQFYGGNFQSYTKHGMYIQFGSVHLYNIGFQSTTGIEQLDNDGWDVWCAAGGVGDAITVEGCRTESLRFYLGNGAQPPVIKNCNQRVGMIEWFPNYTYQAGTGIKRNGNLYRVINTHTTGPTFETNANLVHVPFNVVESPIGKVENSYWEMGKLQIQNEPDNLGREVNADYTVLPTERWIGVDCSNNNVTVTLHNAQEVPAGQPIHITRLDNNPTYTCTVYSPYFDNLSSFEDKLYATPEGRSRTYRAIGGGIVARRYYRDGARIHPVMTAAGLASTTPNTSEIVVTSDTNDIRRGDGSTTGGILVQGGTRRFTGTAEATVVLGASVPSPTFSIPIAAGATYEISGVIGYSGDTDLLSNFMVRGSSAINLFQDAGFATRVGTLVGDYFWSHVNGKTVSDRTVWSTVFASGTIDLAPELLDKPQGICKFSFRITVTTASSGTYDFRFYNRVPKVGTPTITGSWDIVATRIS